jgi:hypothetical protein
MKRKLLQRLLPFLLINFLLVDYSYGVTDTNKVYTPNGDLAYVSFYDNNGILQYKKIFWQDLPNQKFVFVSKAGFVTVKNGISVDLDSSTPDNITEIGIDKNLNVITYIWKGGKKTIYDGGGAEGTQEIQYEGDNPGVYEWHKGKLKFIRKLNKKDLEEKERANKESEDVLKMMQQLNSDSTKQK